MAPPLPSLARLALGADPIEVKRERQPWEGEAAADKRLRAPPAPPLLLLPEEVLIKILSQNETDVCAAVLERWCPSSRAAKDACASESFWHSLCAQFDFARTALAPAPGSWRETFGRWCAERALTNAKLKEAVAFCARAGNWTHPRLGHVADWHTRFVTGMSRTFEGRRTFNEALRWDTKNVTDMSNMFRFAAAFNQPLGDKFDTSEVTKMDSMFSGATAFNQPLGDKFDTSEVTVMDFMFSGAAAFNQPLGDRFDTSKVLVCKDMFVGATALQNNPAFQPPVFPKCQPL